MDSLTYEKEYRVHVYETGPGGKLNIYSLFNYLQDIASDHADVNYLKWVIDSYELGFMMKYAPRSVEINYLAESVFNQEVSIRSSRETDTENVFNHSVIRNYDKNELCTIRIEWEETMVKKVN